MSEEKDIGAVLNAWFQRRCTLLNDIVRCMSDSVEFRKAATLGQLTSQAKKLLGYNEGEGSYREPATTSDPTTVYKDALVTLCAASLHLRKTPSVDDWRKDAHAVRDALRSRSEALETFGLTFEQHALSQACLMVVRDGFGKAGIVPTGYAGARAEERQAHLEETLPMLRRFLLAYACECNTSQQVEGDLGWLRVRVLNA